MMRAQRHFSTSHMLLNILIKPILISFSQLLKLSADLLLEGVCYRVKKVPPGTALFEVVSEELYVGLIRDPSGSRGTYKSGLLEYCEPDGTRVPLIYSPNDVLVRFFILSVSTEPLLP